MTSNNDNDLLDLAFNVKMLHHQAQKESKSTGKEDYYQGRVDACRMIYMDAREKLGLDEEEFNKRVNGRFALRCLEHLLYPKGSTLTERGWEVIWENGRYVITYEDGRFTSIIEGKFCPDLHNKE